MAIKKEETKNTTEVDLKEETKDITPTEPIIEQESGKAKKIVMYCLKGLAVIATAAVGFLIGRGTAGGDKDDDEEAKDEDTDE